MSWSPGRMRRRQTEAVQAFEVPFGQKADHRPAATGGIGARRHDIALRRFAERGSRQEVSSWLVIAIAVDRLMLPIEDHRGRNRKSSLVATSRTRGKGNADRPNSDGRMNRNFYFWAVRCGQHNSSV